MQTRYFRALKAVFLLFFICLMTGLIPVKINASDEEEIIILKNRILELEKRNIENAIIINDLKDLLLKISKDIDFLKTRVEEHERIVATVPRRVPRLDEKLEVEDTTVNEVRIEDISTRKNDVNREKDKPADIKDERIQDTKITPPLDKTDLKKDIPTQTTVINDEKKKMYNDATKLFNQGSFDKAMSKYREFINMYSDDDLTDNAQYWIGECYLKQGQHLRSIEEFQKVIEYYPLGNKVPDAYLKIGYAYQSLKDNVSALQYFRLVKDMFPNTDAAKEADKKISELSR